MKKFAYVLIGFVILVTSEPLFAVESCTHVSGHFSKCSIKYSIDPLIEVKVEEVKISNSDSNHFRIEMMVEGKLLSSDLVADGNEYSGEKTVCTKEGLIVSGKKNNIESSLSFNSRNDLLHFNMWMFGSLVQTTVCQKN